MDKSQVLLKIIEDENINTVFQPIVSLKDGEVLGYEALSRISIPECSIRIDELFQLARNEDRLWALEKLCRKKALKNSSTMPKSAVLFLNVDVKVMEDLDFKSGFTKKNLENYGIPPESIVFEITEKTAITDINLFRASINYYQSQNFKIAIDDFGSGYSGLNRLCSLSTNFLKIDINLIKDINKQAIKKSIISSIVDFCKKSSIKTIAEGIETRDELKTLIELGIDYGQGYYLALPKPEFQSLDQDRRLEIIKFLKRSNEKKQGSWGYCNSISNLGIENTPIKLDDLTSEVFEKMKGDKSISEFFVVDSNNRLKGILTRRYIFEKFSGQFGYNLSKRTKVRDLVESNYLQVDEGMPLDRVAEIAMERPQEAIYDSIAVTRNGKYLSTVTVKDLLLASIQSKDWERGFILSKNRSGFSQEFPIASLSISIVNNRGLKLKSLEELSKIIAETKKEAKKIEGNAIVYNDKLQSKGN